MSQKTRTSHPKSAWIAVLMLLGGYLGDQASKIWVVNNMVEGQTIPVFPPLLHWYFIRNSGAAFSIGEDFTWVFTIIQAVALVYVLWLLITKVRTGGWYFTLGALAAGIAGNLTDRLFREPGFGVGHVVDFIALPNFAIFNVADSLIVGSMVIIVLMVLFGKTLDGHNDDAAKESSTGPGSDSVVVNDEQAEEDTTPGSSTTEQKL